MNLQEAILTNLFVSREKWGNSAFCYFLPNTGPYKDLVDCDYFVFLEDGEVCFSTSGPDLYGEDFLASDYIIYKLTNEDVISLNNI